MDYRKGTVLELWEEAPFLHPSQSLQASSMLFSRMRSKPQATQAASPLHLQYLSWEADTAPNTARWLPPRTPTVDLDEGIFSGPVTLVMPDIYQQGDWSIAEYYENITPGGTLNEILSTIRQVVCYMHKKAENQRIHVKVNFQGLQRVEDAYGSKWAVLFERNREPKLSWEIFEGKKRGSTTPTDESSLAQYPIWRQSAQCEDNIVG